MYARSVACCCFCSRKTFRSTSFAVDEDDEVLDVTDPTEEELLGLDFNFVLCVI